METTTTKQDKEKNKKEKKQAYARQWRQENPLYYLMYYHTVCRRKKLEQKGNLKAQFETRPEGYVISFGGSSSTK